MKKVTKSFLNKLADDIYNPKTKKFLRLCKGKLLNGPDPTNNERPMHCGIGELYFAITGVHPDKSNPETWGINELNVIDLTVKQAGFKSDKIKNSEISKIKKLNIPAKLKATLIKDFEDYEEDENGGYNYVRVDRYFDKNEGKLRELLGSIPDINDDEDDFDLEDEDDVCDYETFLKRSKRVAAVFRKAAKLLP